LDVAGFGDRWRFRDGAGRVTAVTAHGPVRSSNALALKSCALADLGIVVQARWIIGRELRSGALVDVFPDHEVTAATGDVGFDGAAAWLVHPSRAYVPLKVQRFADYLQRAFALGPPGDRGDA
nr:LysR substrate-binding domain-containing protein [Gemmatimonadaceae bacterium]